MNGQIFISYRRSDSAPSAGRLFDRLAGRFTGGRVFMDVDNLDPGVDFVDAIEAAVGQCDVLIVVIGANWLEAVDAKGHRRLDNPEDIVRLEVATALKRRIRVIPILVDDAAMPRADELPDELKPLTRRNALELSHTRYKSDIERLIDAVDAALTRAAAPADPAPQAKAAVDVQRTPTKPTPVFPAVSSFGSPSLGSGAPLPADAQLRPAAPAKPNNPSATAVESPRSSARPAASPVAMPPAQPEVLLQLQAYKRFTVWVHMKCQFTVTSAGVEFVDSEDPKHSFSLSLDDLRAAILTNPRGFLKVDSDLLLILRDGTHHEVGFDDGDKDKALAAIAKLLALDTRP